MADAESTVPAFAQWAKGNRASIIRLFVQREGEMFKCMCSVTIGLLVFILCEASSHVATAQTLMQLRGGEWCSNISPGPDDCTECQSDGNGGSILCTVDEDGRTLTPYINAARHLRFETAHLQKHCGGDAKHYYEPGCMSVFRIVNCNRKYPWTLYNNNVSWGFCPSPIE